MKMIQIAVSDVIVPDENIELSEQIVEGLKKIIEQYGTRGMAPIIIDSERRLVNGYNRFLSMKECGMETMQAIVVDDPEMAAKIRAALNVPLV